MSLLRAVTDTLAVEPEAPVVLGSTDPRVFCAGADLTISEAERAAVSDLIYDCCEIIITRPGPVIAVLTGQAVVAARNWPPRPTCGSRLGRWPPGWPDEAPTSRR